jgi:hypothetical protein
MIGKNMSNHKAKSLEFELNPGITVRVGKSRATVRFQFPKGQFKKYLAANNHKLQHLGPFIGTVSGCERVIALPNGLLRMLVAELAKASAADATLENDISASK